MAWIRQLDSGLWAATYYTPTGPKDRDTITDPNKKRLEKRVGELERQVYEGTWIDPDLGKQTVGKMWDLYKEKRSGSKGGRKRDESVYRCHVAPRWQRAQIAGILKPDAQAWVSKMEADGVGAATVEQAVVILRALMELGVDSKFIRVNPIVKIKVAPRPTSPARIVEFDEQDLIVANLDKIYPDRPDAGLFVETLFATGARWEEAAASHKEAVDVRNRLVHLAAVVERDGTIRPYPKSPAGDRWVPIGDDLWPRFYARWKQLKRGELLFTSVRGGVLNYSHWLARVWNRGISLEEPDPERIAAHEAKKAARAAAGRPLTGPPPRLTKYVPLLEGLQPTPHDTRHTYGTRLADAKVPVHDIMALMGHENLESAQIYLKSRNGRHDVARAGLANLREAARSRS